MYGIYGIRGLRDDEISSLSEECKQILRQTKDPYNPTKLNKRKLLRDLIWVSTSPPFFIHRAEKTKDSETLGVKWFETVKDQTRLWCDKLMQNEEQSAAKLESWFGTRVTKTNVSKLVLGSYFSYLFEYYLENCLKAKSLNVSVRVIEGKKTLGSLKFVWKSVEEVVYHLEISVKFFCMVQDNLVGPHLTETLVTRRNYATRKLEVARLAHEKILDYLKGLDNFVSFAAMKGYLFFPWQDEKRLINVCKFPDISLEHEARWYCMSSELHKVVELYSKDKTTEKWTILPKLYWMSALYLEQDEEEEGSVPLLNLEDLLQVVRIHFQLYKNNLSSDCCDSTDAKREKRSRRRRSSFSPLLLAQVCKVENAWIEISRGFVLPNNWDPWELILNESHDAPALFIHNIKNVHCLFDGLPKNLETKTKELKKSRPGNFVKERLYKNLKCSKNVNEWMGLVQKSLLVHKNESLELASKSHAQQVVRGVSLWLQDTSNSIGIYNFLFTSLLKLISIKSMPEHVILQVGRVLIRACESAVRKVIPHNSSKLQITEKDNILFSGFILQAIEYNHLDKLVGSIFASFDEVKRVECKLHQPRLSEYLRNNLIETEIYHTHEVYASLFVGLIRYSKDDFDLSERMEYLNNLLDARLINQSKSLVEYFSSDSRLKLHFIRTLYVVHKNHKDANKMCAYFGIKFATPQLPEFCAKSNYEICDPCKANNELQAIVYVDTKERLEQATHLIEGRFKACRTLMTIGFDCEWGSSSDIIRLEYGHLSLLQLCVEESLIFVVDLLKLTKEGRLSRNALIHFIDYIFDSSKFLFIGFSVKEDLRRLKAMFGRLSQKNPVFKRIDCQALIAAHVSDEILQMLQESDPFQVGLYKWALLFLGIKLEKQYQCSEWDSRPMTAGQIHYAALDALCPKIIAQKLVENDAEELSHWAIEHELKPGE